MSERTIAAAFARWRRPSGPLWTPLLAAALLAAMGQWPSHAWAGPFDALAEHLIAGDKGRYGGPTVPWPTTPARPADGALRASSLRLPLAVDAEAGADPAQVERALLALERAYEWADAHGFALAYPPGLRVYLRAGIESGAAAGVDSQIRWDGFDASTSFALLDAGLRGDALERCALSALVEAGARGRDPAEPAESHAALARYAVLLAHGELGCLPEPEALQASAGLGPLGGAPAQRDATALILSWAAARHDPQQRGLIAGLFALMRQRSTLPDALHARPGLWEALSAVLDQAGESLDDAIIELAVSRFLLATDGGAALGLQLAIPKEATVPLLAQRSLAALPMAVTNPEPLATYGSAYARVDLDGPREGRQLRVWLRAEPGARWSLVALRLDAHGRELGRVAAPSRHVPDSFLPIELDADTVSVVVVVTKLPKKQGPLPVLPTIDEHDFKLSLDAS